MEEDFPNFSLEFNFPSIQETVDKISSMSWKPLRFASWFPTLISCSPNLPRVYIRLCKHGNYFTFFTVTKYSRDVKTCTNMREKIQKNASWETIITLRPPNHPVSPSALLKSNSHPLIVFFFLWKNVWCGKPVRLKKTNRKKNITPWGNKWLAWCALNKIIITQKLTKIKSQIAEHRKFCTFTSFRVLYSTVWILLKRLLEYTYHLGKR